MIQLFYQHRWCSVPPTATTQSGPEVPIPSTHGATSMSVFSQFDRMWSKPVITKKINIYLTNWNNWHFQRTSGKKIWCILRWGGSKNLLCDEFKRHFVQPSDFCLFVLCTFPKIRFIGWRHERSIYGVNVNIVTCQLIAHASLSHIVQYRDLEGGETLGSEEEDICALEKLFWKRDKSSGYFNNGSDDVSGDNHSEDSSRQTEAFSLGSDFLLNSI